MPVIPLTFQDTGRFVINPLDLFVTPVQVAECSMDALQKITGIQEPSLICDPGCGTGRWGLAARKKWKDAIITGVDIHNSMGVTDWLYIEPYTTYCISDFIAIELLDGCYDLVVGNPPYSSATDRNLAEKFIWKSRELLRDGGYLAFLLKTEYLASLQRSKLFKEWPPQHMIQYVPRIHWDGFEFSNTIEYAFYIWQKSEEKRRPQLWWLNWRSEELY